MKLRNIILMTASIAMTACSKQAVPTAIPEDAKIRTTSGRASIKDGS